MKSRFKFIRTAAVAAVVGAIAVLSACTSPAPRVASRTVEQTEMAKFEETDLQRHCYLRSPKSVSWDCTAY